MHFFMNHSVTYSSLCECSVNDLFKLSSNLYHNFFTNYITNSFPKCVVRWSGHISGLETKIYITQSLFQIILQIPCSIYSRRCIAFWMILSTLLLPLSKARRTARSPACCTRTSNPDARSMFTMSVLPHNAAQPKAVRFDTKGSLVPMSIRVLA